MKRLIAVSIFVCGSLLAALALGGPQVPAANGEWPWEGEMHAYFVDRFLESPGNGLERTRMPPMMLQDSMRLTIECPSSGMSIAAGKYKLDSLELIGIAKHPSPVAFVPFTHSSSFGKTRPLTAFEQKALSEFNAKRTVVSEMDGSEHGVVVGAVEARPECLHCHQGYKTGSLLGAFSYRLTVIERFDSPAGPKRK